MHSALREVVDKPYDPAWYVTELVQCRLKHYYRLEYPLLAIQNVGLLNMRMLIGKLLHDGLELLVVTSDEAYALREVDVVKAVEIDGKEYVVRGRADLIVNGTLYEIKTVSKAMMNTLPYPHHVEQVQLYLDMFEGDKVEVSDARLLYVVLSDMRMIEFDVTRDATVNVRDVLERKLRGDEPTPLLGDWECRYCPYKTVCRVARNA